MNSKLNIEDDIDYYYVENGDDISLFSEDEWDNLQKMYKLIDNEYHRMFDWISDDQYTYTMKNISKKFKDAIYNFNEYGGWDYPDGFEGYNPCIEKCEILEKIIDENSGESITINKFRNYVVDHYDKIKESYEYLMTKPKWSDK